MYAAGACRSTRQVQRDELNKGKVLAEVLSAAKPLRAESNVKRSGQQIKSSPRATLRIMGTGHK